MFHYQNLGNGRILPMRTMEEFNAMNEALEKLMYNRYLYKFTGDWLWLPITDSQTEMVWLDYCHAQRAGLQQPL